MEVPHRSIALRYAATRMGIINYSLKYLSIRGVLTNFNVVGTSLQHEWTILYTQFLFCQITKLR